MPAIRITDAFVRNVKPPSAEGQRQITYLHNLERGLSLVLVVSYGGTKTFRALTYVDGKPRSRKLGSYPQMSVRQACAEARAYWADPAKFEAQEAVGSFQEIAEGWLKRHVVANKLRSRREIERQLNRYVFPAWKGRRFLDIRRREVNELLDHIADKHGRSQADAVLATLRGMMAWYQSRDENYTSPIVRGMRRTKPSRRERILSDEQIRAVWRACDEINGTFGALIKVLLLTAQRREKVASMRWADLKGGVWTIPEEERQKGTGGKLNLPKLALDAIEAQPHVVGNPHVFAARGKGPFNSFSQRKEGLDRKLSGMEPWTLHDLRRTARSLMSRAGVRPDIAERVLGHAIAGVEGVYDRHRYDAEKADALNKLAHLIETIIKPEEKVTVAETSRTASAVVIAGGSGELSAAAKAW